MGNHKELHPILIHNVFFNPATFNYWSKYKISIRWNISSWLLSITNCLHNLFSVFCDLHFTFLNKMFLLPLWANKHLRTSLAKKQKEPKQRLFIPLYLKGSRVERRRAKSENDILSSYQRPSLCSHATLFLSIHVSALSTNHWGHWNLACQLPFDSSFKHPFVQLQLIYPNTFYYTLLSKSIIKAQVQRKPVFIGVKLMINLIFPKYHMNLCNHWFPLSHVQFSYFGIRSPSELVLNPVSIHFLLYVQNYNEQFSKSA